jgi:hypothetical protein
MARNTKFAKLNLNLEVDERTDALTNEALFCRTFGHKWELRAKSRSRTLEALQQGVVEYDRFCGNNCGCTWRQVWSIRERMIVENERSYPKNGAYLMKSGNGRLNRTEAWAAQFTREMSGFL